MLKENLNNLKNVEFYNEQNNEKKEKIVADKPLMGL